VLWIASSQELLAMTLCAAKNLEKRNTAVDNVTTAL
jgi:hypothetical protein